MKEIRGEEIVKKKNKIDQGTTGFHSLLAFLRYNAFGRFISILFLISLVFTLNILFSANDLEKFALITGIELVVVMIAGWTVFLIKRNSTADNEEETEG